MEQYEPESVGFCPNCGEDVIRDEDGYIQHRDSRFDDKYHLPTIARSL